MELRRTYKYRLYPTRKQERLLEQTLYLCHQLYNLALEQRIRAYNQEDRQWICPECKNKLDRDLNASVNILQLGRGATEFKLGEICQWTDQRTKNFLKRETPRDSVL